VGEAQNGKNNLPKSIKNRSEGFSQPVNPQQSADSQAGCDPQPDITSADGKAEIQPQLKGKENKNQICRGVALSSQGSKKVVTTAQDQTQYQSFQKSQSRL
jgi:hypothetical protein